MYNAIALVLCVSGYMFPDQVKVRKRSAGFHVLSHSGLVVVAGGCHWMVIMKIINQLCPMLVQKSGTNSQYVFLEEKWFAWNFLPDNGSVI